MHHPPSHGFYLMWWRVEELGHTMNKIISAALSLTSTHVVQQRPCVSCWASLCGLQTWEEFGSNPWDTSLSLSPLLTSQVGGRVGVIFVSRSDLNLFFLYCRITPSYFLSALCQVCLPTAGWTLVCHSLLLPSSAQGRIICTEQGGTFLHFLSLAFLFHSIYHIPRLGWCSTMRDLKPQKLCKPEFLSPSPNSRAENSWRDIDIKLILPARLTYLSPASRSSGQWGHGAGATILSAPQQLLHPLYKATVGTGHVT